MPRPAPTGEAPAAPARRPTASRARIVATLGASGGRESVTIRATSERSSSTSAKIGRVLP